MTTTNQPLVSLVSLTDYMPVLSVSSLATLKTCQLKESTEKFLFLSEVEKVIPQHMMRNLQCDFITYMVTSDNIILN
jgi:hypothetical protein